MANVIFKYPFALEGSPVLELPVGHRILEIQDQRGWLTLWALVDDRAPKERVQLKIVGTGKPIHPVERPENWIFIATVQQGEFVWHIFQDQN